MTEASSFRPIAHYLPFGGWLCLDFANTVNGRLTEAPEDLLTDTADLIAWGRQLGLLADADAVEQMAVTLAHPVTAAASLTRALVLRETIFSIFAALATSQEPARAEIERLNDAYRAVLSDMQLVVGAQGVPWRWERRVTEKSQPLDWLFWPVTRSAVDLLTSDELSRLKRCAGADRGCAGLFIDETKNRIRRWCSMDGCGSRAKMRRLYARHRASC